MSTALDVLLSVLFLIVLVWVAVFGLSGMAIARQRGYAAWHGFLLGALAGPFGWGWILFRTRNIGTGLLQGDGVDDPGLAAVRGTATVDEFPI